MGKKTKKPQIRFAGFTDDWEQRKLGATNTFFTDGNYGEAYPKSSDMTDSGSGIPFLTGGNLKDGKLSLDGASYITPEKHSKLTSGHLLEDDIVIAVRGSLGALGYVNTDNSGWNINSQLAILRTDKSELYGKFLIQYLLSWTGQNELLKRQTGSALKQLPIGAIKDVEVPITSIAEQGKIGEYFSNLDNLITLHQRKLSKLKNIKKSMLEKMFPQNSEMRPEIRFAGFTDDWEQRKLGDVADVTKLAGFEFTEHIVYSDEGNIIALRGLNIKNGQLILDDVKYIDGSNFSKLNRSKLYMDDIMFTYVGTVGEVAIIKENDRFYLAPNVSRIRIQSDDSPKFISHYMRTDSFYKSVIYPLIATSSQPALSMENIRKFEICLPRNREEQDRLSEWFDELDHLITLHQRKLEKLGKIKKAMLEKMFV